MKIAVWKRFTKNGQEYVSVGIEEEGKEKIYVNCFLNKKTKDTQPDYRGETKIELDKKPYKAPDTNFEEGDMPF